MILNLLLRLTPLKEVRINSELRANLLGFFSKDVLSKTHFLIGADKLLEKQGIAGITLGHCVVLKNWVFDIPTAPLNFSLIGHELKHIEQIEKLGIFKFYLLYLMDWIIGLIKSRDQYLAYRHIRFEVEAYDFQDRLYCIRKRLIEGSEVNA